jgi:hypothetical protein
MLNKAEEIAQMFLIWMKYNNLHKEILKQANNFNGHERVSMHT